MTCAHAHTRTHTPHDPGPHPRPPKPPLRTPASQQERRVRLGRFISIRFASGPLWGTGLPRPPVGGWGYVRSAAGSRAVVWTAASGFCGARLRSGLAGVRLGRAGCRVERVRDTFVGRVRRGAQLCMHVTRSLVRGRHTRPWSWPMALWFPHAAWGRGLTHGGCERSQRAVRGSSMAAVSVEEIRVLSWHAVSGPDARQ